MTVVRIGAIVEGHGEVDAVPVLLRRIAREVTPHVRLDIEVFRIGRQRVVKPGQLEHWVEIVARRTGPEGRILILLDADRDCPARVGPALLQRARNARNDRLIRVVLAKIEFETWLIAAAESLAGECGLPGRLVPHANPEAVRDAKGWLNQQMPPRKTYKPKRELVVLTRQFDLQVARSLPSFDKMWRDVEALLQPRRSNTL